MGVSRGHSVCMKQISAVQTQVIPRTSDIGQMEVKRALPSRERRSVGSFVFWDQMGPGELIAGVGIDVRPHPHIGLSTLTYLFKGHMQHRDSLGNDMVIGPEAVNLMTAGSGIVHSERSDAHSRAAQSTLFGIQSWLALPKSLEEQAPVFSPYEASDIPAFEDDHVQGRLIMGALQGMTSPVAFPAENLYLDLVMSAGGVFEIPSTLEERAVYAASGAIRLDGLDYPSETLLVLTPGRAVRLEASEDARVLVFGGEPLDGPRHLWWNFVSSSKDRIEQAKDDWQAGRFDQVPGETEWIPLPDV